MESNLINWIMNKSNKKNSSTKVTNSKKINLNKSNEFTEYIMSSECINFIQQYGTFPYKCKFMTCKDNSFNISNYKYNQYIQDLSNLPDTLTNISGHCGCSKLTLPKNCTDINLTRLNNVEYCGPIYSTEIPDFSWTMIKELPIIVNAKYLSENFINSHIKYINGSRFLSDIETLNGVFIGCGFLEHVVALPNSITEMNSTFAGCKFLKYIDKLPNSLKSMNDTFNCCENLLYAPKIPDSVNYASNAFYKCVNLRTPSDIPFNCTYFSDIYYGCYKLKGDIYIHNPNIKPDLCNIFGNIKKQRYHLYHKTIHVPYMSNTFNVLCNYLGGIYNEKLNCSLVTYRN